MRLAIKTPDAMRSRLFPLLVCTVTAFAMLGAGPLSPKKPGTAQGDGNSGNNPGTTPGNTPGGSKQNGGFRSAFSTGQKESLRSKMEKIKPETNNTAGGTSNTGATGTGTMGKLGTGEKGSVRIPRARKEKPKDDLPLDRLYARLLGDSEISITREKSVALWDSTPTIVMEVAQQDPAFQPKYDPKAINEKPGIVFSRPDDVLIGRAPTLAGNQRTVIFIVRPTLPLARRVTNLVLINGSEGIGLLPDGRFRAYMPEAPLGIEPQVLQTAALPKPEQARIVAVRYGDGMTELFVNGKREASISYNLATVNIEGGAIVAIGGDGFSGAISDVYLYNKALSAEERRMIETKIATRYGITLLPESAPIPVKPRLGRVIQGN
ncbi:hypothetical protein DB346_22460 [Verrucomicrobia bacterium LW23]|nr:hypothetical protein DB346_22460 [Verrucomicrobia bacterium LW23]